MNILLATILVQLLQEPSRHCYEFDLLPEQEQIIKTLTLDDAGMRWGFTVSSGDALTQVCLKEIK